MVYKIPFQLNLCQKIANLTLLTDVEDVENWQLYNIAVGLIHRYICLVEEHLGELEFCMS
jgi:hypothetical protein